MRSNENAQSLSVQATHALVSRLDALIEWGTKQTDISPTGHAKRSDIHRTALILGVTLLEERAARKTATAPDAPAVGVFQEPDTVHLLEADLRKAIAQLASVIIGQNDELLAAVKALREEIKAPRSVFIAEAPAVGENLELTLTAPEPAVPVSKRRSFADNPEIRAAAKDRSDAIRELETLRKAFAACKGQRQSRNLIAQINAAEKRRTEAQRTYDRLRAAVAAESNP